MQMASTFFRFLNLFLLAGFGAPGGLRAAADAPAPVPLKSGTQPLAEEYKAYRDPSGDGWGTEAFYEEAKPQLKALGKLLAHPQELDAEELAVLLDPRVTAGALRPVLQIVTNPGGMEVRRPVPGSAPDVPAKGAAGFTGALRKMLEPWGGKAESLQTEFKLFKVRDLTASEGTVEAYVFLAGQGERFIQQSSTWTVRMSREEGKPPVIRSVTVSGFEEVSMAGPQRMFLDQTTSVLGGTEAWGGQLLYGIDHWRNRIEDRLGVYATGLQGMAIGDVNGDGLDDIYYCAEGGLPNRLFLQKPDGSVEDASASSGADILDPGRSALLLDLDNDGDQDIVISAAYKMAIFFSNDGAGHFTQRRQFAAPGHIQSMSAVDYDHDRLLDVYLSCYNDAPEISDTLGAGTPSPFYDARNGLPNVMLHNDGDFAFRETTKAIGLDHNNDRYSFGCTWEDYDNDGDQDLYVVNDFGRKNLYRNDEGKFKDAAAEAGVEDIGPGMGACWGDVNGDGLMDLHVANMFSGAGNRIAFQGQFLKGEEEARKWSQRFAKGNTLYLNEGNGKFRDVSDAARITFGRWAWGAMLTDLNNDGWRDIFVANGYITGEDPGDL